MTKKFGRLSVIGAVLAIMVGFWVTPAQADTDWIWTYDATGYGKFWTDPGGSANEEKMSVCDASDDGWGILLRVEDLETGTVVKLQDSLQNYVCVDSQYNMFPEGHHVQVTICRFVGHVYNDGDLLTKCGYADAIA